MITADERSARTELEDDYHRMGVRIEHDGSVVTAILGDSSRHPWQLCARAVEELPALVGAPLTPDFVIASRMANARDHCTHLFDLAALAITAVARQTHRRIYDSVCSYDGAIAHLRLYRDEVLLLDWRVDGSIVHSTDEANERDLRQGFAEFCRIRMDREKAEASLALRRTAMIAQGRGVDLDQLEDATIVADALDGACYALRKEKGPQALRLKGATRSFDGPPPLTPHSETRKWFSTPKT
ncbi:DUF2889 domain-containing protein [Novosphingobium aquae]|uniref:DUF2889 domain-containing protein n=1 Tax=Novosphingobium aquae TaxID=3133435 RepID=A0ABU8SA14_9SPHN